MRSLALFLRFKRRRAFIRCVEFRKDLLCFGGLLKPVVVPKQTRKVCPDFDKLRIAPDGCSVCFDGLVVSAQLPKDTAQISVGVIALRV